MKPQDIIFLIVVIFLIWKHNPKIATMLGIISLIISIPLFAKWVFFTAERLTYYAAGFFLLAIIFELYTLRKGE